jgi:hypothetical protein
VGFYGAKLSVFLCFWFGSFACFLYVQVLWLVCLFPTMLLLLPPPLPPVNE